MYIYDYVLLFGWFWWPATLCTVNRIGEMVSFDLGKEIEKDVFRLVTSVGQRKTSESPWGIELQTFRAPSLSHRDSITKFICHVSCILLGPGMSIASPQIIFFYPNFVTRRKTSFSIFMYFNLEISDRRLENAFFFVSSFLSAFCQITSWKVYQTDFLTAFPSWHICEWNSYLTKEIIVKN